MRILLVRELLNFELITNLENENNAPQHVGNSIKFWREKKEELHASVSAAEEVKTPKISHVSPIC